MRCNNRDLGFLHGYLHKAASSDMQLVKDYLKSTGKDLLEAIPAAKFGHSALSTIAPKVLTNFPRAAGFGAFAIPAYLMGYSKPHISRYIKDAIHPGFAYEEGLPIEGDAMESKEELGKKMTPGAVAYRQHMRDLVNDPTLRNKSVLHEDLSKGIVRGDMDRINRNRIRVENFNKGITQPSSFWRGAAKVQDIADNPRHYLGSVGKKIQAIFKRPIPRDASAIKYRSDLG